MLTETNPLCDAAPGARRHRPHHEMTQFAHHVFNPWDNSTSREELTFPTGPLVSSPPTTSCATSGPREEWRGELLNWIMAPTDFVRRRVLCEMPRAPHDPEWPRKWHRSVIAAASIAASLDWLVLSEHPEILTETLLTMAMPINIWAGRKVGTQGELDQVLPALATMEVAVRFILCESLEHQLQLPASGGIDWVIADGHLLETTRTRERALLHLRDQCLASGIKFFLAHPRRFGGCPAYPLLDGRIWDQVPGDERWDRVSRFFPRAH